MPSAGIKIPQSTGQLKAVIVSQESTDRIEAQNISSLSQAMSSSGVDIAAVNSALRARSNLTDIEEQATKSGHSLTPGYMNSKRTARARDLVRLLKPETDVIRYVPQASMDSLLAYEDDDLESLGVETGPLQDSGDFEAALGAVTARLYSQGQFKDQGIIVPSLGTD